MLHIPEDAEELERIGVELTEEERLQRRIGKKRRQGMFKCLNCGFIFKNPDYKQRSLPKGAIYAIDPRALNIPVCPKCGSDAIVEV